MEEEKYKECCTPELTGIEYMDLWMDTGEEEIPFVGVLYKITGVAGGSVCASDKIEIFIVSSQGNTWKCIMNISDNSEYYQNAREILESAPDFPPRFTIYGYVTKHTGGTVDFGNNKAELSFEMEFRYIEPFVG